MPRTVLRGAADGLGEAAQETSQPCGGPPDNGGREQDRQALRTKQARSGAGSWGRTRSPLLGVPPGRVGAGGKAASQSGLLGDCTALEAAGRDMGVRGKVTAAPPTHRVHAGLPGGPVRDTQAGPAGSLQPCVGRGDDSQGLAPSRKILQRMPF